MKKYPHYLERLQAATRKFGKIGAYPPTRISFNRSVLWLKQA
jgi:hypothetical protein